MPFIYPTVPVLDLKGKTIIIPIVSTANVAQLAVDLLIASLSLQRIAAIDPTLFIPVVSGREDGLDGVSTALELFGKPDNNVVVMQQRSPVLKSRKQEYIAGLLDFLKNSNLEAVLFLAGVELTDRTDAQMFTPIYHVIPSNSPSLESSCLKNLSNLPIPPYTSPVLQRQLDVNEQSSETPFIPGGGLTRRILSSIPDGWPLPTAGLLQFVLEGDNRADSKMLATVASKLVGVDNLIDIWKQPSSWREGLFGAAQDQTLYG